MKEGKIQIDRETRESRANICIVGNVDQVILSTFGPMQYCFAQLS